MRFRVQITIAVCRYVEPAFSSRFNSLLYLKNLILLVKLQTQGNPPVYPDDYDSLSLS